MSNDCDDDIDCRDSDCRTGPTNFCPDCLPEEICVLGSGDEDCNGFADCNDLACVGLQGCPTPTPTPDDGGGGGDDDPPDPCEGDECCGRGRHTECTVGECDPDVQICGYTTDPYTGVITADDCVTYPGDCQPDMCFEVCN